MYELFISLPLRDHWEIIERSLRDHRAWNGFYHKLKHPALHKIRGGGQNQWMRKCTIENHNITDRWLGENILACVSTPDQRLFPTTCDCRIPRYTWLQYIISRNTWCDVLFTMILLFILNKNYGTTLLRILIKLSKFLSQDRSSISLFNKTSTWLFWFWFIQYTRANAGYVSLLM